VLAQRDSRPQASINKKGEKLMRPRWLASICLLALSGSAALGHAAEWLGTWGAAPLPPSPARGPFPATPAFSNQTIRQVLRLSAGGSRLRLRLSNEYGTRALHIGGASIALADGSGAVKAGTERTLTFDGKPEVSIPPGAPWVSDPVDLPVAALGSVSISLYLPEDTGACTCHATGMQNADVSAAGDFTHGSFTPDHQLQMRAFISGVEVQSAGKALVVLGDSISDGVGSTLNANHRWPDLLAERLEKRNAARPWGVINLGISGNRVLSDGAGQSALARFDRDVLSVPGAAYVIVFEGVNDLGLAYGHASGPMSEIFKSLAPASPPTAAALIAGYRQLIERAHAHALKVIGATITPYGGAAYYSEEGEAVRQAINAWIRTGRAFDGVVDFDAVLRDPAQPTQIREGLHAGDHLHGSDAGYEAMAKAVDLALLR
jgi:lysophospholipase L1-like esterase